jgi:hypothetical protein
MNSDPARPPIAASAPPSAQPLPTWWTTWNWAQRRAPSNFSSPPPFGSFIVPPGVIFFASGLPSGFLNCFMRLVSSWYTLCAAP